MTQDAIPERDPVAEWWEIHGNSPDWTPPDVEDPWANGRYAIAALVLGLIVMVVLSVAP